MRMTGLEPARATPLEPKSSASANSATSAHNSDNDITNASLCQHLFLFFDEFFNLQCLLSMVISYH